MDLMSEEEHGIWGALVGNAVPAWHYLFIHLQDTRSLNFFFSFFTFFVFRLFRASPMAYGGPQARGPIGAVAAGLRHSHSNAGSEPCLRPHGKAGSLTH